MNLDRKMRIGITIGDPSGIGPEIVLKALARNPDLFKEAITIVFGHFKILSSLAQSYNILLPLQKMSELTASTKVDQNIIYCYAAQTEPEIPPTGKVNKTAGHLAYGYICDAIEAAKTGIIDTVATAPINKEAFRLAEIPYLDHTEIFSSLTKSKKTMTLFVTGDLRIFFLTRHLALKNIFKEITPKNIMAALESCQKYLCKIGIKTPRIALAALNPHGGEGGMFGREEIEILQPAVQQANKNNMQVEGPVPADAVFHLAKEGRYDAVLSLYHDQGHIAAKTLDFRRTISMTMGLPFLRTSVDHGTALDIAGKNIAGETSMVEAIKAAKRYAW